MADDSAVSRDGVIEQIVTDMVARQAGLNPAQVALGHDLYGLGIDSVAALTLMGEVEDHFDCAIDETRLWNLATVQDLVTVVAEEALASPSDTADDSPAEHPFARCVNPRLAMKMAQVNLDHEFTSAEGACLYKGDKAVLDFTAQFGALPFGHNPERIWSALSECFQRKRPGMVQPSLLGPAGELAETLLEQAPGGLGRVTFCNSGAESIEVAIKIARSATGRRRILSTHNAFHGKTFGALSASGRARYQKPFRLPEKGFDHIPYADTQALERTLAEAPERYAAFIVEPIQGEGGVVVPPAGYLAEVRRICSAYGVLYVADEVQTGLGRAGALFASAGTEPDIVTLSKALGGGMVPVGACLCRPEHYTESFGEKHSSTFAGNALAMTAGLATLEWLCENDQALIRHVTAMGDELRQGLLDLQCQYPGLVASVRGRGLMLGLELRIEPSRWDSSLLAVAADQEELTPFLAGYLLNVTGVRVAATLNAGNVLRIQPPLTVGRTECQKALAALDHTLAVLDTGNIARLYRGLRTGQDDATLTASPRPGVSPRAPGAGGVAFVLHPLDAQSYRDYDPTLGDLDEAELAALEASVAGNFESFVASRCRVESAAGVELDVDFIMVPYTTRQLVRMPRRDALGEILSAFELARDRGASVVGLGAYTSILTGGGERVSGQGPAVTPGNAYTAVAGVHAVEELLDALGETWAGTRAAVVGASGSVGGALTALLLARAPALVLIGNVNKDAETARSNVRAALGDVLSSLVADPSDTGNWQPGSVLDQLRCVFGAPATWAVEEILGYLETRRLVVLSGELAELASADVALVSTSSPEPFIGPEHLAAGSLICDLSRPRNVAAQVGGQRPDVLVLDGGIVRLPGAPSIGNYGLRQGEAYACMAESILIGLEGDSSLASVGRPDVARINELERLARHHGFRAAPLRSFGELLDQKRIEAVGQRRRSVMVHHLPECGTDQEVNHAGL